MGSKNENSLKINEHILSKFSGGKRIYSSADSIIYDDEEEQQKFADCCKMLYLRKEYKFETNLSKTTKLKAEEI